VAKQDYSEELTQAISKVAKQFPNENVGNMLKFVASAETDYGRYNPETAYSYGPFQIDPVRYYDIAQNPERVNKARLQKANEFLRAELDSPDFDISNLAQYNPETQDYVKDTRNLEALMQDPNPIPGDVENMSKYYLEDFWRPAVQTEEKRQDAIRKFNMYNPNAFEDNMVENTMSSNDMLTNAFK
jgi:hypothetical protein